MSLVHPEGFEPPILGTGNLRFIQLSYGCLIIRLSNRGEICYNGLVECARVAQWIRASVFGTEGRRFESVRGYQLGNFVNFADISI